MRKRFRIAIAIIALTVLALLAFHSSEPSYEGKSLSGWIILMREREPTATKARAAVHHLGTNSIPLLLRWLRKEDSPTLTDRVYQSKRAIDEWLIRKKIIGLPHRVSYNFDPRCSYRSLAQAAFQELGAEGKAAIPTLIQMLGEKGTNTDISNSAGAAYLVFARMAPASISPLIQALSCTNEQTRILAAGALDRIGPAAIAAIPVLEKMLDDKRPGVRASITDIICQVGGDPGKYVPIIIQSLGESDYDALTYELDILQRYTNYARPAVPVLIEILNKTPESTNTTNIIIRQSVLAALHQLDPEANIKLDPK